MSDNLRDRIAAVLLPSANYCQQSMTRPCDDCMESARKKADAVIGELGLRPELGQRSKPTGPLWGLNNRYNVTRYVTEWKNNDE
jgi:hypothetical protein